MIKSTVWGSFTPSILQSRVGSDSVINNSQHAKESAYIPNLFYYLDLNKIKIKKNCTDIHSRHGGGDRSRTHPAAGRPAAPHGRGGGAAFDAAPPPIVHHPDPIHLQGEQTGRNQNRFSRGHQNTGEKNSSGRGGEPTTNRGRMYLPIGGTHRELRYVDRWQDRRIGWSKYSCFFLLLCFFLKRVVKSSFWWEEGEEKSSGARRRG